MSTTRAPSLAWPEHSALAGLVIAVRRHPLLVAGVTLAAVAACFAWSRIRSPVYEATATMLVTPLPDDPAYVQLPILRESGDPTRDMQTAAALVDSQAAARLAAARMGAGWTAAGVASAVDVLPQGESQVLDITARAGTPVAAGRLANTFAQAALDSRRRILAPIVASLIARAEHEQQAERRAGETPPDTAVERLSRLRLLAGGTDPSLSLAHAAQAPVSPAGRPLRLLLPLAAFAGAALALAAAVAIELLRTPRITGEQQLEGITGLPVVARVPRVHSRRGRRSSALELSSASTQAFRAMGARFVRDGGLPRSIMVTSASRGDGKTTSALHLGLTLADAGRDVLLVDLDPRNPELAGRALGLRAARAGDSAPAVQPPRPGDWEDHWRDAVVDIGPGLHLMVDDTGSDGSLGLGLAAWLPYLLPAVAGEFDCVIIDAPSLDDTQAAPSLLLAVDAVLVVARLDSTAERDVEVATRLLERIGREATGLVVVGAGRSARSATDGPA
jgi:Mrp family chromosome partitioning ATPase